MDKIFTIKSVIVLTFIMLISIGKSYAKEYDPEANYYNTELPSSETKGMIEELTQAPDQNIYSSSPELRAAGDPNDPNNDNEPELGLLPIDFGIKSLLVSMGIYFLYTKRRYNRNSR